MRGGGLGVTVFFVLSGYLITSTLLKEQATQGRISLSGFYLRRALRLFPALFALLAVSALCACFWQDPTARAETYRFVLYTLCYAANWARSYGIGHAWLGHCWSLAIEEQFYLLWPPLLVLLGKKLTTRSLLYVLLGLIGLIIINRAVLWHGPDSFARVYNGLDTRGDALLIGCALGLLHRRGYRPAGTRLAVCCAALLTGIVLFGEYLPGAVMLKWGGETMAALASAVVISTATVRPPAWLCRPWLVWVGRLSYSLYLWHLPAVYLLGWPPGWHEWQLIPLRLALSFVLAGASYYFIELPFLRRKNRTHRVPSAQSAL
jgi:peptidoglycan/LPS O-acetylase OafA/YrhL